MSSRGGCTSVEGEQTNFQRRHKPAGRKQVGAWREEGRICHEPSSCSWPVHVEQQDGSRSDGAVGLGRRRLSGGGVRVAVVQQQQQAAAPRDRTGKRWRGRQGRGERMSAGEGCRNSPGGRCAANVTRRVSNVSLGEGERERQRTRQRCSCSVQVAGSQVPS